MGVRCVVAAGWAVDDDAAEIFANSFYSALLAGQPFIAAVGQAREDTWSRVPHSKTWAAYQCYGDPNWVFRRGTGDAQAARQPDPHGAGGGVAEGIASAAGLALVLEDLAIRTRYATGDRAAQQAQARTQLRELQDHHGDTWGGMGAVAEAFGVAWEAAQDLDAAIAWYTRALRANDASASVRAHEQLGKLQVERAWARVQNPGTKLANNANGDDSTRDADAAAHGLMREELAIALRELQTLVALQPTVERLTLMGLAWQRQAQLQTRDGLTVEGTGSLTMALQAYSRAESQAADAGSTRLFEAALLRMAVELVGHAGKSKGPALDATTTARARRSLQTLHDSDPDFQTHASLIQLDLFEALAAGQLAQRQPALAAAYAALQAQVPALARWALVLDAVGWVLETAPLLKTGPNRTAAGKLLTQLRGYARPAA
jgi:tetratricopeptide (TPR) repeat protein